MARSSAKFIVTFCVRELKKAGALGRSIGHGADGDELCKSPLACLGADAKRFSRASLYAWVMPGIPFTALAKCCWSAVLEGAAFLDAGIVPPAAGGVKPFPVAWTNCFFHSAKDVSGGIFVVEPSGLRVHPLPDVGLVLEVWAGAAPGTKGGRAGP